MYKNWKRNLDNTGCYISFQRRILWFGPPVLRMRVRKVRLSCVFYEALLSSNSSITFLSVSSRVWMAYLPLHCVPYLRKRSSSEKNSLLQGNLIWYGGYHRTICWDCGNDRLKDWSVNSPQVFSLHPSTDCTFAELRIVSTSYQQCTNKWTCKYENISVCAVISRFRSVLVLNIIQDHVPRP